MSLDPTVQIGAQLAIALAGIYAPGAGQTVTALSAIFAAVQQYNANNGKPADYVPTREDWDLFIADRESKRIPPNPPT